MHKKHLFFFLCILLSFWELKAQEVDTNEFVILVTGLAEEEELEEAPYMDSIHQKWKINYQQAAGCVFSQTLEDSINTANKITFRRLINKYGSNWKEKYISEINTARELYLNGIDSTLEQSIFTDKVIIIEDYFQNRRGNKLFVTRYPKNHFEEHKRIKKNQVTKSKLLLSNLNDDNNSTIYRGFDNVFELKFNQPTDSFKYSLECINCIPVPQEHLNKYVIRTTGSSRDAQLKIQVGSGEETRFDFKVSNLPPPIVHLNGVEDGGNIGFTSTNDISLSMKFPPEITLKLHFQIIAWELNSSNGLNRKGKYECIDSDTIYELKQIPSGSIILFMCQILSPDGIIRKKSGTFTIK